LKPEHWGSPLVQENYQEAMACDKRHPYCIIIIIIMEAAAAIVVISSTCKILILMPFQPHY